MTRFLLFTVLAAAQWTLQTAHALDSRADVDKVIELIEAGQLSLARTYLEPALIDPRLSPPERSRAYYLRGYSYFVQGMHTSAANDYGHALEFNPENPAVLAAMGSMYFNGFGRKRDYVAAYGLFEQAAALGHPGALMQMGHANLMGLGVERDLVKAREYLTQAADLGSAPAMFQLASSYRTEFTDQPEPTLAQSWFEKAHEAGSTDALVALGYMYQNGELGEADQSKAIEFYKQAAEAGSGPGQVSLGHACLVGAGVEQDYALAQTWLLKAAEQGVPSSYLYLGHMYLSGEGAPIDVDAARGWFERGAKANSFEAQIRLAYLLLKDPSTHAQAREWLARAVAHDHPRAHNDYAWMLATSKHDELRDGALALEHALAAVDGEPSAGHLDTLAAAYAELAQFEQAISVQLQALDLIKTEQPELLEELHKHLVAYQQSQPWRE
ncbi:MAG: hypothetical protein O3A63_06480 [Proteobacteria bacterium]|nr:hypothetical protein [Pseudomonadota bacterium]